MQAADRQLNSPAWNATANWARPRGTHLPFPSLSLLPSFPTFPSPPLSRHRSVPPCAGKDPDSFVAYELQHSTDASSLVFHLVARQDSRRLALLWCLFPSLALHLSSFLPPLAIPLLLAWTVGIHAPGRSRLPSVFSTSLINPKDSVRHPSHSFSHNPVTPTCLLGRGLILALCPSSTPGELGTPSLFSFRHHRRPKFIIVYDFHSSLFLPLSHFPPA